jgi:hypothetical protein
MNARLPERHPHAPPTPAAGGAPDLPLDFGGLETLLVDASTACRRTSTGMRSSA